MVLRQVPQVQAALVSLDPATGRVVSLVNGWSYDTSQFNRATQAKRQPGVELQADRLPNRAGDGVSPSRWFPGCPGGG